MPKRIRKSILVGQIILAALGVFLFLAYLATIDTMNQARWWYTGPAPAVFLIPAILCLVGVVLLCSVLRYEVKEELPRQIMT
jgi:hypothetical protein